MNDGVERCETVYRQAYALAAKEPTEETLSRAIELLESIDPWKNSHDLIKGLSGQLEYYSSETRGRELGPPSDRRS